MCRRCVPEVHELCYNLWTSCGLCVLGSTWPACYVGRGLRHWYSVCFHVGVFAMWWYVVCCVGYVVFCRFVRVGGLCFVMGVCVVFVCDAFVMLGAVLCVEEFGDLCYDVDCVMFWDVCCILLCVVKRVLCSVTRSCDRSSFVFFLFFLCRVINEIYLYIKITSAVYRVN